MSGKYKAHRKAVQKANAGFCAKLARDTAKAAAGLHNRFGGGCLPSQMGWGQHKADKARVTLPDPWRKP